MLLGAAMQDKYRRTTIAHGVDRAAIPLHPMTVNIQALAAMGPAARKITAVSNMMQLCLSTQYSTCHSVTSAKGGFSNIVNPHAYYLSFTASSACL